MSKHTPERWTPESIPLHDTIVEIRDSYGGRVCAIPADYPLSSKSWQWRINLIAAAPEMLESLSDAVLFMQFLGKIERRLTDSEQQWLDNAATLLSRIEGGGE